MSKIGQDGHLMAKRLTISWMVKNPTNEHHNACSTYSKIVVIKDGENRDEMLAKLLEHKKSVEAGGGYYLATLSEVADNA